MEERLSRDLPPQWKKEVEGLTHDETATHFSLHRTEMSTHRTLLSDARSHMANERTHLAYLRTSLSLMSFGITLNRFSEFLQQNKGSVGGHGILKETAYVGIGIVVLGIIILGWSLIRFRKVEEAIENDNFESSTTAVKLMTLFVLILGGLSTLWMFWSKS